MRRALLALALIVAVACAFIVFRLSAHAMRIATLQARLSSVTVRCAALNDEKHRLVGARLRGGAATVARLDAAIDRCERELSAADIAWGAEAAHAGWRALW